MAKEQVYPRKCTVTGKGIKAGFYVESTGEYISDTQEGNKYLLELILKNDYKSLDEAYDDEYYYYTEWEENDVDSEGNLYLEDGTEVCM